MVLEIEIEGQLMSFCKMVRKIVNLFTTQGAWYFGDCCGHDSSRVPLARLRLAMGLRGVYGGRNVFTLFALTVPLLYPNDPQCA
jgi:hypothetical protein